MLKVSLCWLPCFWEAGMYLSVPGMYLTAVSASLTWPVWTLNLRGQVTLLKSPGEEGGHDSPAFWSPVLLLSQTGHAPATLMFMGFCLDP